MKQSRYVGKESPFYKKKAFLSTLIGLFFITIMASSALYYGLNKAPQGEVSYHGLHFVQSSQGWKAYTSDGHKILIATNPEEFHGFSFSSPSLAPLQTVSKIYVSVNPYDIAAPALQDLQSNLQLSAPLVYACYEDSERCASYPLKDCSAASSSVGVILLKEANETSVSFEHNCLTLEAEDLLKVADKIIVDQYGNE